MTARRPELGTAIEALYPGARWSTLPGDASTRRFHRLLLESGGTRIVMDYGAPFTGETDDVKLARIFERAELPVAHVMDILPEAGAIVLEDLGDVTLEQALDRADAGRAQSRRELYATAVALAARIATKGTDALARSDRAAGPALDRDRFTFEMRYFLEHYVAGFLGRRGALATLEEPLLALAASVAGHPRVMCHRDYHSRNLMVTQDGALAMVDIQDARWGPDTYDVVSLLRDAYVDLTEDEVREHLDGYLQHLHATADHGDFGRRFHEVAAQRMIKALGTFGFQISRLGRERYRSAIPRTVQRLRRLLPSDPATEALGACLEKIKALSD